MGPRQSTANPQGGNPNASTSSGVRTGATNSALVNNMFGDYGLPGHDNVIPTTTPRHQHHSSNNSNSGTSSGNAAVGRSPAAPKMNEDGASTPQHQQQQNQSSSNNNSIAGSSFGGGGPKPKTVPLCLRYKYQPSRSGQNAQQGQNSSQRTVPLPPPPQHGIAVDLFDGDGKHIANLPLVPSEGEFFAVIDVPAPSAGEQPFTQYFRFVVDGHKGMCHPHLPTAPMPGAAPIIVQHQGPDGQLMQSQQLPQANFVQVFGTEEDSEVYNNLKQNQQSSTGKDAAAAAAPVSNNVNNIINDEDGWSQNAPVFEETRKFPPIMPPHLRYTPLNAPPTRVRVGASDEPTNSNNNNNNPFNSPHQSTAASSFSSFSNTSANNNNNNSSVPNNANNNQQQQSFGNLNNTNSSTSAQQQQQLQLTAEEDCGGLLEGSDQRPAPLSVTINHVYFQKREDHTLVGITTRYQDKCTSIAYYKHDPLPVGAVPLPMPLKA